MSGACPFLCPVLSLETGSRTSWCCDHAGILPMAVVVIRRHAGHAGHAGYAGTSPAAGRPRRTPDGEPVGQTRRLESTIPMPSPTQQVLEALRPVEDPELHRSIVDLGMVRDVDHGGWRRRGADRA